MGIRKRKTIGVRGGDFNPLSSWNVLSIVGDLETTPVLLPADLHIPVSSALSLTNEEKVVSTQL